MPTQEDIAYTLRIDLTDSKPPIWRRIAVDSTITLRKLHAVIQAAFGWTDSHLHDFEIDDETYGDPDQDPTGELEFIDESKVKLGQLVGKGVKFLYRYDFGDNWEHRIKVEAVEAMESLPSSYAWLITGKRACPPEDVGGVWGYDEFLESVADPNSERGRELLDWAGCDQFDPEHFDIEEAKAAVSEVSGRRKAGRATR